MSTRSMFNLHPALPAHRRSPLSRVRDCHAANRIICLSKNASSGIRAYIPYVHTYDASLSHAVTARASVNRRYFLLINRDSAACPRDWLSSLRDERPLSSAPIIDNSETERVFPLLDARNQAHPGSAGDGLRR